jgi:diacylglycerol kinase (ATP)
VTPATGQLRRREISKVTALTNPLSGHGTAIHAAQAAIARLHARGVEVVEIIGDDAEDARHLAAAALERGTDALVATGGDGVISNALQVLAGAKKRTSGSAPWRPPDSIPW